METIDILGGVDVGVGRVAGLPVEELTRRLVLAMQVGEACQRALAFYLREMEARRLFQAVGYSSTVHFAINRVGLSKGRAQDLLRAGRRLEGLPELDAAFARGELCWSKVRLIARVASGDNQAKWIERCRELTAEQVEAITACVREGEDPPSLEKGLPQARFTLRFHVGALGWEMFEQARAKLAAETGRTITEDELFGELVRLFLSSDADGTVPGRKAVDGSLFRVAVQGNENAASERDDAAARPEHEAVRRDAAVPRPMRRRVLARDGHRCRHCGSGRSLMLHHVVWRSEGGNHRVDNLLTLCARCHGLVHEGFLQVAKSPDGTAVCTDRAGRGLWEPLPGRPVLRPSPAPDAAALAPTADDVPEYLEPHQVPAVVDGAWWLRHQHCLEWSRDGRSVHLRRPPAARTRPGR